MSESDVELAELRFLEAHLQHRARICYAMVAAGMVCLVAGVVMLVVGLTGDQVVWVQSGNLKITAGGLVQSPCWQAWHGGMSPIDLDLKSIIPVLHVA
jgi:hypothetical protein